MLKTIFSKLYRILTVNLYLVAQRKDNTCTPECVCSAECDQNKQMKS